ncbi:MAG: membrane or secreted protein [Flavobacteriales bacterium]|nr:membrane or secreted protein [Flavobacteriales bacterium]
MIILVITIIILALSMLGIAIKLLLKKDGKFSGTCASQSPFLNKEGEKCGYCGKLPEDCENK